MPFWCAFRRYTRSGLQVCNTLPVQIQSVQPFHSGLPYSILKHVDRCKVTVISRGYNQKKPSRVRTTLNHFIRFATSTTAHSTASDPAETEALLCLEQGTQKLEDGDVQAAKALYKRSVEIKRDAGSLFNLGVTCYHLKEYDEAISAWNESIDLQPNSPDAHTNLASAYIISPVSRPDLALHHLSIASNMSPEDPEIAFNYAAVLEACGKLEEALVQYKRSKQFGVERAAMHIRNVSAKILGQRIKASQDNEKS